MRTTCLAAASLLAVLAPARARADDELPTIDTAFPAAVRVATTGECQAHVTRIAVDVAPGVSWLTFEVASRAPFCTETTALLDVPAGTRIVGMSATTHGARSWSAARPRSDALARFRAEADATLLAWDNTSADQDHVRVLVDSNARVELALELPPLAVLAIDPSGAAVPQLEARVTGQPDRAWRRRRERVDLDVRAIAPPAGEDRYPHATAGTWLVAGAPDRDEPQLEHRFAASPRPAGDGAMIRRAMKANRERFAHCYDRELGWGFGVSGEVTLSFLLARDGTVETVAAAGTLPPSVTACITDVVRAWPFSPIDMPTQVNYPLTFRVLDDPR